MSRYPHMDGATAFPGTSNVDVWRYKNDFNYDRWNDNVHIKVCSVPWCGDYDNVADFGSASARDAWFNNLTGTMFDLDTMVHILPEQTLKLPVPAPALQPYNYLVVDLPRYTSDAEPVEHAGGAWKSRYYFFLDNVIQRAASTSECVIRLDYWTTYKYDMTFDYVMLTRGHAPVSAVTPDEYLSSPIDNATYLLAPDVTYASPRIATKTGAVQFDSGDSYAVVVTAATFWDDWGDLVHPKVPSSMVVWNQGVCGNYAIACDTSDFETFCRNIDLNCPQFLMCVQGVFFISKKCIEVSAIDFPATGVQCYQVHAAWREEQVLNLTAADFGYPADAAGFAKLYTYPYAELVVTDATGSAQHIRIEDTTGRIGVRYCVNTIMPWVSVDTQLTGVGGAAAGSLTFENIGERYWQYNGAWWDTVRRYSIPVYSVNQSALTHADYTTDYLREQAALAAANNKTSADASANTAHDNAVDSANTAERNVNNSASNLLANNAITVSANSATTATSTQAASDGAHASNANNDANTSWDNASTSAGYQAQQDALAVAATNNDAKAAAAAVSTIGNGLVSIGASAATGNVAGVVSGAASMITGSINAGISWTAANAANAVSQSNSDIIYQATIAANNGKMANNTSFTTHATDIQNTAQTEITNISNNASTSIANNNATLMNTNAANTRATQVGNADRTQGTQLANNQRTYDTAMAAIQANLNQAGVAEPLQFGQRMNGDTCVTRPLTSMCSIVTQPTGAIMQTAAMFARYGYNLNQQWRIENNNFQIMEHFTYWECSEVWCAGTGGAPEVAQQAIKDIMSKGVTVWSDPNEIGMVSIYDNI